MGAARASKTGSIVVLVATAVLVLPTVQGVGWSLPPLPGDPCTITGTSGPDTLTGTAGDDVICGRDGDDTITGLGGDDVIRAGEGADVVNSGPGNDFIAGGAGDDSLNGGEGADIIRGHGGVDLLIGADGDDDLSGGEGNDDVRGGAGVDRVAGYDGDDTVNGGADNDEVLGGAGVDWLLGSTGLDRLHGGPGNDLVNGGDDADDVRGGIGDDTLLGGNGDDLLQDRDGAGFVDHAVCGAGTDLARVDFFDTVAADCETRRNLDREDPVAVDDAATVDEDDPATAIDVLANDTDADGGPKKVDAVTQPVNGTVVITGAGSGLTYEPNSGYCNNGAPTDDFTYTLAPGGDTATVAMTVTCNVPVAVDDDVTLDEDDPATTIDVRANDSGAAAVVDTVTQPANGTVAITNAGADLTYQPDADYCNNPPDTTPDTFTYTLTPGGSTATVSVQVDCVDDDPVAVDDVKTVTEDDAATTIDVLANDTDIDGGPISIASATDPAAGTVVVAGDGSDLTYTPDPNACNNPPGTTDDFTYTLAPGGSTATVRVTIDCVIDPAVAADDTATVVEDDPAAPIAVLANDTPGDGGITITGATDPANGTVTITGGGTGLTYQPDPNYCNDPPATTLDTFDYTVDPGGDTATVSVTVTCVNDAPVADDETYSGTDAAVGNTVLVHDDPTDPAPTEAGPHKAITGDLLAGDTDIDSAGPLTITAETVNSVDGGSAVIEADGDFVYTPAAGTSCADTTDSFAYNLNDGDGGSDIGVVTINITGCVWYVNNNAAGDAGTSNAPFNTLAQAQTASGANHTIYLYDGDNTTTGYNAGIALKAGQRLLGELADLQIGSDLLATGTAGNRPTITASGIDVVTLDDGNTLRGLEIDPSGVGSGIAGGSGDDGGTIADVRIIDAGTAGTQPALELDGTSGSFAVSELTVSSTGATGVRLNNAGTVSFADTGTISVTTSGAKALDLAGTNLGTSVFDTVTVTGSGSGGVSATSTTGTLAFGNLALTTISGSAAAFFLSNAAGVTVPASGTATISATGGPAVDVSNAAGAVLSFDSVSSTNSASNGVRLVNLGTGTFDADAGTLQGAGGIVFDVAGGSGDVTYDGAILDGSSLTVNIVSRTGGIVTLSGQVVDGIDAGGGISLANNTGGSTVFSGSAKTINTGIVTAISMVASDGHTLRFTNGGLDVDTTSGSGFSAETSGTVTVTGTGNTITTTSGRALGIINTDIGADDVTFRSISATSGASRGIVLDTTGASGNLVVTGNGGTCTIADQSGCSGGTIAGFVGNDDPGETPSGTGIVLRNTTAPSFTRIHINGGAGAENYGIRGTNVNGFTLADSVLDGTIGTSALTAHKDGGLRFGSDIPGNPPGLTGTVSVTNTAVSGGYFTNIMVDNTSGVLNATFNNVDSLALDDTGGDDAVQFEGIGTADMNVTYTNSQITDASGDLFQYIGDGTGGGDLDLTNNAFTNNEPSIVTGGGGIALVAGANGPATMDVLNNTMRDSKTNMLTIIKSRDVAAGTNNLVATIDNNDIGVAGVANSGSVEGDGMELTTFGDGNATFTVTNNDIRQYNSSGIQFVSGGGVVESGQMNLNVSGNTVANPGTTDLITLLQGIRVDSGVADGDNFATCVDFGPNSITGSSDAANKDFRLFAFESGIRQPGYGGGNTDDAAFAAYAASLIGGGAQGTAFHNAGITYSGTGTTCP